MKLLLENTKMPSKELTQKQFNTIDGTVYAVNIDCEEFDIDSLVDYLDAKCQGWFMRHYETDRKNQFLFELESDTIHYKNWAGWSALNTLCRTPNP